MEDVDQDAPLLFDFSMSPKASLDNMKKSMDSMLLENEVKDLRKKLLKSVQ